MNTFPRYLRLARIQLGQDFVRSIDHIRSVLVSQMLVRRRQMMNYRLTGAWILFAKECWSKRLGKKFDRRPDRPHVGRGVDSRRPAVTGSTVLPESTIATIVAFCANWHATKIAPLQFFLQHPPHHFPRPINNRFFLWGRENLDFGEWRRVGFGLGG